MLKIQRQAAEFMNANKAAVADATVQKLGANRAAVEQALGANNVEYIWKLDDKVQGQAKTYAQHMLELKQIRAAAEVRDVPESEVLERDRQLGDRPPWPIVETGPAAGGRPIRSRRAEMRAAATWRRAEAARCWR